VNRFRAPFLRIKKLYLYSMALGALCAAGLAFSSRASSPKPEPTAVQSTAAEDPAAFAAELRALEAKLLVGNGSADEALAVRRRLPRSWTVETPERRYEISSEPLRDLLDRAARNDAHRKEVLEQAGMWAENAATQAEAYVAAEADSSSMSSSSTARTKLEQILKRREFSPAGPPSAMDQLRQKIGQWVLRMFEKLFGGIAQHPMGSELLFWLIIFGVVCWLVTMLVRFWTGRGRNIALQPIGNIAAHRSWQEWIRGAQDAAARGEFREAIHLLYWAGITRLEDLSILTVDHTRTPREQLRLLSNPAKSGALAAASATPAQRTPMVELTTQLERVWYGRRPASAEDFRECLKHVEDLGCRLT
jgi:hypothetical protein